MIYSIDDVAIIAGTSCFKLTNDLINDGYIYKTNDSKARIKYYEEYSDYFTMVEKYRDDCGTYIRYENLGITEEGLAFLKTKYKFIKNVLITRDTIESMSDEDLAAFCIKYQTHCSNIMRLDSRQKINGVRIPYPTFVTLSWDYKFDQSFIYQRYIATPSGKTALIVINVIETRSGYRVPYIPNIKKRDINIKICDYCFESTSERMKEWKGYFNKDINPTDFGKVEK